MIEPSDRTNQEEPQPAGGLPMIDFEPRRPLISYLYLVYLMVTGPRVFFSAMSVDGGYMRPWLFVVMSLAAPFLLVTLFYRVTAFQLMYLMAPVGYLIMAGGFHLFATGMLGGKANFQATFRVVAYTSFTAILGPIDILGMFSSLYGLFLAAHGMAAVHRINFPKGALSVLLTVLGLMLINLMLFRYLQTQMEIMG